jgi:hypothetical protein
MKLQYEEKIVELLFDADDDALEKWMDTFTQLERMDIARELAIIGERILTERGYPKAKEETAKLLQNVADWEETYLNMEVCNLKQELAEADYIKSIEAMRSDIDTLRAYMLESIYNNAPNAQELLEIAGRIIAYEKERGLYDPMDWLGLE